MLAISLVGARPAEAGEPLHFVVPEGWTDLSPGAPGAAETIARLRPDWKIDATSGRYAALAVDLRSPNEGVANLSAIVEEGAQRIDANFLNWFPTNLTDGIAKQTPGVQVVIKEKRLVTIGTVTAAEFHLESRSGSDVTEQLLYAMPAGTKYAQLTYSAPAPLFPRYRPIFEAAARGTTGLALEPTDLPRRKRLARALEYLGVAVIVIVLALRKRRQLALERGKTRSV